MKKLFEQMQDYQSELLRQNENLTSNDDFRVLSAEDIDQ